MYFVRKNKMYLFSLQDRPEIFFFLTFLPVTKAGRNKWYNLPLLVYYKFWLIDSLLFLVSMSIELYLSFFQRWKFSSDQLISSFFNIPHSTGGGILFYLCQSICPRYFSSHFSQQLLMAEIWYLVTSFI